MTIDPVMEQRFQSEHMRGVKFNSNYEHISDARRHVVNQPDSLHKDPHNPWRWLEVHSIKLPDRKRQLSFDYVLAAYKRGDFTLTNPPMSTQQFQQTDNAADGKDTGATRTPQRESTQPYGSKPRSSTVLQDAACTSITATEIPPPRESPRPCGSDAPTLPGVKKRSSSTKRA